MCFAYCPPPFFKIYCLSFDSRFNTRAAHSAFGLYSPFFSPCRSPASTLQARLRCYHSFRADTERAPPFPSAARREGGTPAPRSVGCTKNMYIELFLLDNFLMNLLTLRAAAAMLSRKMKGSRAALVSFAGAAAAAAPPRAAQCS